MGKKRSRPSDAGIESSIQKARKDTSNMGKKRSRPSDAGIESSIQKARKITRDQEEGPIWPSEFDDAATDPIEKARNIRRHQENRSGHPDFYDACHVIDSAIKKASNVIRHQKKQFTAGEYMKTYTTLYNICTHRADPYSKSMHDKYCETLANYIKSTIMPSLREKHDEFLLSDLWKRWLDYKLLSKLLHRFFCYLDRYYIPRISLEPLAVTALRLFRELVLEEIKGRATDAMINMITKEREGGIIDRSLLKNVLSIYVDVDDGVIKTSDGKSTKIYEEGFEDSFLRDTAEYYSRKSSGWILEDSCLDYIRRAEDCMKLEKERVSQYLLSRTESNLLSVARKALITEHLSRLLEEGITGFKVDDLSRIYKLCSGVEVEHIQKVFRKNMTAEVTALVQQEGDLVGKLLKLHDEYMGLVRSSFQGNILFHKALKDAFEVFCNKRVSGSSMAELLAVFCDCILKGGSNGDESAEEKLEKAVMLLVYVDDKDHFAEFCRKKLARRLLFNKNTNTDREKSFLSMLKQMYGGQFSSKMERMVNDSVVARDDQKSFDKYVRKHRAANPGSMELNVTVLTTGFWPSYKSPNLNLPKEMARSIELFKELYHAKTKSRTLTWIFSLGSCHVMGNFQPKPIELNVTTLQASVLLLFNTSDRLSCSEVMSQLNVPDEDANRLLHSLSSGKYKVLKKEPETECISQSDYFEFNPKFTHKFRRVQIPLPAAAEEKKKVISEVEEDRRCAIDASIVRIMKSRKALDHQQLVIECVKQLSRMFKPDMVAIKKRIEDLINRSYIERDPKNINLYKYLA